MTLVSQMYLQNKNVMVRYRRSRVPPKIEYRRQILLKLSFLGECDFIIYGQFALVKARACFIEIDTFDLLFLISSFQVNTFVLPKKIREGYQPSLSIFA